jgi:hypothetical protein
MIALCIVGGPPLTGDTLVVGPRCGLPVFARNSAWTSIPLDSQINHHQILSSTYPFQVGFSRVRNSCISTLDIRLMHFDGFAVVSGESLRDA